MSGNSDKAAVWFSTGEKASIFYPFGVNGASGHYRVCSRSHKDWWLPLFRAPHGGRMTSSRGQNLSEVRV